MYVSLYVFLFLSLSVYISLLSFTQSLYSVLSVSLVPLFLYVSACLFLLSLSVSFSLSFSPPPIFSLHLSSVSISPLHLCSLCIFLCLSSLCLFLFVSSLSISVSLFFAVFQSLSPSFPVSHSLSFSLSQVFSWLCISPTATSFKLHLPCLSLTSGEEIRRHNLPVHNGGTLGLK